MQLLRFVAQVDRARHQRRRSGPGHTKVTGRHDPLRERRVRAYRAIGEALRKWTPCVEQQRARQGLQREQAEQASRVTSVNLQEPPIVDAQGQLAGQSRVVEVERRSQPFDIALERALTGSHRAWKSESIKRRTCIASIEPEVQLGMSHLAARCSPFASRRKLHVTVGYVAAPHSPRGCSPASRVLRKQLQSTELQPRQLELLGGDIE